MSFAWVCHGQSNRQLGERTTCDRRSLTCSRYWHVYWCTSSVLVLQCMSYSHTQAFCHIMYEQLGTGMWQEERMRAALVSVCNFNLLLQVITCVVLPQRLQEAEGRNQELTSTISQGGWHNNVHLYRSYNCLSAAVLLGYHIYSCSYQTSSEADWEPAGCSLDTVSQLGEGGGQPHTATGWVETLLK